MKCQAIIFDADGTLAETEELHRKAFNKTFQNWGLIWYWDVETYKQLLKVSGGRERLDHYVKFSRAKSTPLTQQHIADLYNQKTKLYLKSLKEYKLKLRPGVKNLIKEAKNKSIKLAIATATSMENVKSLIETTSGVDINDLFSVVVTSDMVREKKPDPEVYKIALSKLNIDPDRCIAIEDSLNGLLSAKGARLRTVITPSFYTQDDNFSEADLVLQSLSKFKL